MNKPLIMEGNPKKKVRNKKEKKNKMDKINDNDFFLAIFIDYYL